MVTRVREYFYDELYVREILPVWNAHYDEIDANSDEPVEREYPIMGAMVGGIGSDGAKSEIWEVVVDIAGQCAVPKQLSSTEDDSSVYWRGVEEPLTRLVMGTNQQTWVEMKAAGASDDDLYRSLVKPAPLADPSMPVQDAIDLTDFLADVAARYLRFSLGPDVVAPPIDLAAITAHEKFKWVRRKHYYSRELNPQGTGA